MECNCSLSQIIAWSFHLAKLPPASAGALPAGVQWDCGPKQWHHQWGVVAPLLGADSHPLETVVCLWIDLEDFSQPLLLYTAQPVQLHLRSSYPRWNMEEENS